MQNPIHLFQLLHPLILVIHYYFEEESNYLSEYFLLLNSQLHFDLFVPQRKPGLQQPVLDPQPVNINLQVETAQKDKGGR